MSTTLQFIFKVEGTPTNATSVVLSSPTGYGVMRTDTGEVLVPDGTPMVLAATGNYRYALTAPAGVPISWYAKAVYNGSTYTFVQEGVTNAGGSPSSFYGTLADLYDKAGPVNVNTSADLESEQPTGLSTDAADRVQARMLEADAYIDNYLSGCGRTGSLNADGTANLALKSDPAFSLLTVAWAWLTVAALRNARGGRDVVTDVAGNTRPIVSPIVRGWTDTANSYLVRYVMAKRRDITTSIATTDDRRGFYPCG